VPVLLTPVHSDSVFALAAAATAAGAADIPPA